MRILLVGSAQKWSLEAFYHRAFTNLQHQVQLFDVETRRFFLSSSSLPARVYNKLISPFNASAVESRIRRFFNSEGEWDLVVVFKGREFTPELLAECRDKTKHSSWVNINPDDPLDTSNKGGSNENVRNSIPQYDHYFVWSKRLVDAVSEAGAKRVSYLPFGFDEVMHRPSTLAKPGSRNQVAFIGSWDSEREKWVAAIRRVDVQVFGWAWERSSTSHSRIVINERTIYEEELASITSESIGALNLLRPQNAGSHNMRTFEVPAMNGLLLTQRSSEQQQFFPENEASVMFDTPEELNHSIERIVLDPGWAKRVRARGLELSIAHTYTRRAAQLLGTLDRDGE